MLNQRFMASKNDREAREDLTRYATSEDPIGVINRGHQYLQAALREVICAYVARPNASIRKQKYERLLALSNTLGVLTQHELSCLRYVDKLRNVVDLDQHEPHVSDGIELWKLMATAELNHPPERFIEFGPEHFPMLMAVAILTMYYRLRDRAHILQNRRLPDIAEDLHSESAHKFRNLESLAVVLGTRAGLNVDDPEAFASKLLRNLMDERNSGHSQ
jgi:hypothetical protein